MNVLPNGRLASRMRCTTSAVSTSKYWLYDLTEK
jgi:hypothetical protein